MQVCLKKKIEVTYSQKGDNFGKKMIQHKENNGITAQGKVDMVLGKALEKSRKSKQTKFTGRVT